MNPAQIFIVADATARQSAQRELLRTRRLPESVQWLETEADAPLRERLRLVAASVSSQRVDLVDGSTTYHSSLIRQASEWNNERKTLALTSVDLPAGLYALSTETLRTLTEHCSIEPAASMSCTHRSAVCMLSRQST